jgi:hypothetical protein
LVFKAKNNFKLFSGFNLTKKTKPVRGSNQFSGSTPTFTLLQAKAMIIFRVQDILGILTGS